MNAPAEIITPPSLAPHARVGTFNLFHILVRREFWEHRVLWIAPLVVAGLYLLACFIPGTVSFGHMAFEDGPASSGTSLLMKTQTVFMGLLFILMSVVIFFYLADCLYAERKDRSILFWKSLPVSDTATVLSKLLVALVVVPVGLFVLAIVTNLAVAGILFARFHSNPGLAGLAPWNPLEWFELNVLLLADILLVSLWFAPVAAYQLLISAWARGSVFIWTVLPPLALVLGERVLFKTWHIGTLIGQRLGMGFVSAARTHGDNFELGLTGNFDHFNMLGILASPQLWVGVAVAAAFVFATIRIRRYRDDS